MDCPEPEYTPAPAPSETDVVGDSENTDATAKVRNPSRRNVVGRGIKLAFVAPVISTFFASDAMAAGSNNSCYAAGHACPGNEPCCSGSCNITNVCD